MSTTITIQIDDTQRTPTRRHIHIPAHESIIQTWFDAQKDQSASVRMLIHEDIRTHGITDRIHRAKFGSAPVVPVMSVGNAAQTPQAAQAAAAAPAPAAAPAAPVAPAPAPGWAVPMTDPRDAEIVRLQAEVSRLEGIVGPFGPFLSDLARGDVLI